MPGHLSGPPAMIIIMNGGMGSAGYGGRLIDRIRATQERHQATDAPTVETVPDLPPPPDVKHVWVTDQHGRRPGLLLRWERRGEGWWGRVSYPAPYDDGWALVEDWLPADQLEQA